MESCVEIYAIIDELNVRNESLIENAGKLGPYSTFGGESTCSRERKYNS